MPDQRPVLVLLCMVDIEYTALWLYPLCLVSYYSVLIWHDTMVTRLVNV